jgi:hypothetical protein
MNKVFFISSWNERSDSLLHRYSKQTPGLSGAWKDIVGVSNINDADYCIVLGGRETNYNFDPDKTIYIKREPDFIEPAPVGFRHTILWKDTHCGITWWINRNYDQLREMVYPGKEKEVSCIVSAKHRHRLSFVRKMIENNDVVDFYGRGHNAYDHGKYYKGELNYDGNCKFLGLNPYAYTVALENSQEKNYWTEKISDAYLSWCIPIYWGCPNIGDFFEPQSYRTISLDDPNPIDTIHGIIEKSISSEDIELLSHSRNKILDEYNIWEIVRKKILEIS